MYSMLRGLVRLARMDIMGNYKYVDIFQWAARTKNEIGIVSLGCLLCSLCTYSWELLYVLIRSVYGKTISGIAIICLEIDGHSAMLTISHMR